MKGRAGRSSKPNQTEGARKKAARRPKPATAPPRFSPAPARRKHRVDAELPSPSLKRKGALQPSSPASSSKRVHSEVPTSPAPMSRWQPPHVDFDRKTVFCMSKAEAAEVYNLNGNGQDPRVLTQEEFSEKDWLQVFTEVPRTASKVKCKTVKKEFWSKFYTLFTSVYQEPPGNYGMEVTKVFARGFLYEHLRGPVNWAAFLESIVSNMDASKLQIKKQRWAAFHSPAGPKNLRRIRVCQDVQDAGDACKGGGISTGAKMWKLGSLALDELDNVLALVVEKRKEAATLLSQQLEKLQELKAHSHRTEGAMGVIKTMRNQLESAKSRVQVLQSKQADGLEVEREQARVKTLELTIETLQGEGELQYDDCSDALAELQTNIQVQESALQDLGAQLSFVASMQHKKSSVLLQVPPPMAPSCDSETFGDLGECSACGVRLWDKEALGMLMLPCKHTYHIYCFAHIATEDGSCKAKGCNQVIAQNIKDGIFVDSGDTSQANVTKIGKSVFSYSSTLEATTTAPSSNQCSW